MKKVHGQCVSVERCEPSLRANANATQTYSPNLGYLSDFRDYFQSCLTCLGNFSEYDSLSLCHQSVCLGNRIKLLPFAFFSRLFCFTKNTWIVNCFKNACIVKAEVR